MNKSSDCDIYEPLCGKGLAQSWITCASRSSMFFENWNSCTVEKQRSTKMERTEWRDIAGAAVSKRRPCNNFARYPGESVPEGRKDYLETRKRSPRYLRQSSCDEHSHRSPALFTADRDIETIHLRSTAT